MSRPDKTPFQDERFLLLETLGRGGMGAAYRAFDRTTQRLVALKVPSEAERSGPAHPLSAEFDVWSRLDHPGIVRAHELCLAESGPLPLGTPYLVLEHVRGGPLHRMLRPGQIAATMVERIASEILSALDHLHGCGFVHRDLKPANVLLRKTPDGAPRIKLTDFGLACPVGTTRRTGVFSGSLPYASPEALSGRRLDGRSDLYGLGILLFYLATGEMPLGSMRPNEIVRWHLAGPPADASRIRPLLSPRLVKLIRRLTHRDLDARPASASDALESLGHEPAPGCGPALATGSHGDTRAGLRLALDAVRLGASRVFRLPDSTTGAELLREVAVWSQIRGVRFYRLGHDPSRLVLRLVVERGNRGGPLIRRYGLHRALPLKLLGGAPLLDRPGALGPGATPPLTIAAAARGICAFLLDCAARRPMVLCVERVSTRRALGRALEQRLIDALSDAGAPAAARGGMLLLIGTDAPRRPGSAGATEPGLRAAR